MLGAGLVAVAFASGGRLGLSAQRGLQQQTEGTGTIEGRVRLTGQPVANSIVRMGADPYCAKLYGGKRPVQEITVRSADGGLANVFVSLTGSFPETPVPAGPLTIDQQTCLYRPRVVGARVGQTLEIRNSDETMHNIHSLSTKGNDFNVSQPKAGMVYRVKLDHEELMLHIKCDVHSWMVDYVGVVNHPYFAVSGNGGTFKIAGVPAGTQTIRAWHERYGVVSVTVDVKPGATTTLDLTYTGNEQAP